jgi:hypothetical protein
MSIAVQLFFDAATDGSVSEVYWVTRASHVTRVEHGLEDRDDGMQPVPVRRSK